MQDFLNINPFCYLYKIYYIKFKRLFLTRSFTYKINADAVTLFLIAFLLMTIGHLTFW